MDAREFMTIEEAIEELGTLYVPRDGEQDRLADAQEMAIRSLEAWEKVKADVNAATITYDKAAVTEDYRTDEQKAADWWEMYKLIIISIIENRLKEVVET